MSITSVAAFAEALRSYHLLDAQQLKELAQLQASHPEPRALARELLQRGWLSAFQINQIFQGKGDDLLLGQYVVIERLGQGGMGQVFKARHRRLDRVDAIKVIRKDHLANLTAVQRFHQEARAAARVAHSNIVSIYDADEDDGTHFLAMEYMEGIDLSKLVRQHGPLPVDRACAYIRQAALGLQHAHERGLIHRDIKPSNLYVNPKDGVVKVLDMGLARMLHVANPAENTPDLTHTGAIMGTPDYISPEQAMNSHQVDIRADIYSLGCTLYFLLAGKTPFPGETVTEKLLKRQLEDAQPIEELRPDVPAPLAAVIQQMMARKPEHRYGTPAEVAAALEPFAAGVITTGIACAPRAPATSCAPTLMQTLLNLPSTSSWKIVLAQRSRFVLRQTREQSMVLYCRYRQSSRRAQLVIGAGVALALVLLLVLVSQHFRGGTRKAPLDGAKGKGTIALNDPPSANDKMEAIHKAFRLKNLQVEGGQQQRAGEQLGITFDLVNVSGKELTLPADNKADPPTYTVGACEYWIERLGSNTTIPGIPLSVGRKGNLYSAGGSVVWADAVVPKEHAYQFANPLETTGYPPGRYRYHIAYQKHTGEMIQKEHVEFELIAPTPRDPRDSLHASLIGKPAFPLEIDGWGNGSPLSADDLKGKVVLLDFWAVWCPPCRAAFPHLRGWDQKYAKAGLVQIGLTRYYGYTWDDAKKAPQKSPSALPAAAERSAMVSFTRHHNLSHRIGFVPSASDLYKRYGVNGIPQVVLIDRQGKIRLIRVGTGPAIAKSIEETIVKLLAER